jgi:hypothetical protein
VNSSLHRKKKSVKKLINRLFLKNYYLHGHVQKNSMGKGPKKRVNMISATVAKTGSQSLQL